MQALYPRYGYPMSEKQLRRSMGKGPLFEYLAKFAWADNVLFFDDFLQDTINLDFYALANSGGTSAANFAINVARSGQIKGDTGTDDNGSISMIMPLTWYGDANAGMEVKIKTDIVTSFNLEVGFIDAVPAANAGGVNDEDTPTFVAGDSALFSIDTDETFKTAGFYSNGSTSGQPDSRTSLAGVPSFTSGTLPVLDTFYTVRIQLVGNNAYCWVNGALVASHDTDADGHIEGGTAVAPWIYCRTRDTTAVFPSIDYIAAWQER